MDSRLAGRSVLVTGASGGIGQAVARAFDAEGASLVLHFHRQAAAARRLAGEISSPCVILGADLREEDQAEALFRKALGSFPRLDAVVVNAGVWVEEPVPLHRMSLAQWESTLRADLTSAFFTCRAFLRHLAEVPRETASIVLIGSTAAMFGEEDHADYAAAKAALTHGLTSTLKNEIVRLAPHGRVNCVCPGWVATSMAAGALEDPAALKTATATVALGRVARPEDVARAVVFLSSERLAGHLSGVILPADGGMEGRLVHN
ncbi:MAG: SDR family NAD(P)-dependent oxidoreductase [Planctomycetota bacterium]